MRIRLEPAFTTADMQKITERFQQEIDSVILEKLIQVCERAIELVKVKIKNQGGYDNHTGNLRSSTGYLVHKDGKIVHKDFKESPEGTDKKTGLTEGLKAATSVLRGGGWGIFLVSGMEYASWVEDKGYDVLTGAMIGYEEALMQAFKEIGDIK